MNIKVGEYIRTKDGIIAKCIEEKQDRYVFNKIVLEQGYYNNYILKDIPERANFITNHSKNIINLIEVRRYSKNWSRYNFFKCFRNPRRFRLF